MSAKRLPLAFQERWNHAKFVSWPPSWSKPLVRVPLPSGRYLSKSVTPLDDELATLERCKALRDDIGGQIWGEEQWQMILSVPARSVAKHRADRTTPRNGVHHEERPGRPPTWVATWYEPNPIGRTNGGQAPRRKRSKTFSYGTDNAQYSTSEQAYTAAVKRRELEERRWYTVIERGHVNGAYARTGNLIGTARALGISYPTAQKWAREQGLAIKPQGYTPPVLPITGLQCRHARETLGLTRDELCRAAGASKTALQRFELGKATLRESTMTKVMRIFAQHRVEFLEDGTFKVEEQPPG